MLKKKTHFTMLWFFALAAITVLQSVSAQKSAAQTLPPPPQQGCSDANILTGPATPPEDAIVVPAGDNSDLLDTFRQADKTFWFAPGVHTLGDDVNSQIAPGDNTTFIGSPGAIIDGQHINLYAFTQKARNITIKYLTIRNFGREGDNNERVINRDSGEKWTVTHNTVINAGIYMGPGIVVAYNCLNNDGQ